MPEVANDDRELRRDPGAVMDSGRSECGEREFVPPRMDILRENEVIFRFLSVGCVVRVGCKEIPFTSLKAAVGEFENYVNDPYKTRKKWFEIFRENEKENQ